MKISSFQFLFAFAILILFSACKSDENDDSMADFKAENRKGLGASASDLLSNDTYQNLRVEFAYSVNFLNARVNKPGGVSITETVVAPQEGSPYTTSEIREIEDDLLPFGFVMDESPDSGEWDGDDRWFPT